MIDSVIKMFVFQKKTSTYWGKKCLDITMDSFSYVYKKNLIQKWGKKMGALVSYCLILHTHTLIKKTSFGNEEKKCILSHTSYFILHSHKHPSCIVLSGISGTSRTNSRLLVDTVDPDVNERSRSTCFRNQLELSPIERVENDLKPNF